MSDNLRPNSRRRFCTNAVLGLTLLPAMRAAKALAQEPEPHLGGVITAPGPPLPTIDPNKVHAAATWRAVYIVGDVDGVTGRTTLQYIRYAQQESEVLRSRGFAVRELYVPDNHWPDVVAAAKDVQVLIYAGHGVRWGGVNGTFGGFNLSRNEIIYPARIRADLRLAQGAAVIMNHVCYSTGTGTEDVNGTTYELAERRVAQYSAPFLELGAAGFFASWNNGYPLEILTALARGATMEEAYKGYWDFGDYGDTAVRLAHPLVPNTIMWLDYDDWPNWPGLQYDHSFAGRPNALLGQAPPPVLAAAPDALRALAYPSGPAQTRLLHITADTGEPPVWRAWVEEDSATWLTLGAEPGSPDLQVRFTPPTRVGVYRAEVIIRPADIAGSEADISVPVELRVQHLRLLPLLGTDR